MRRGAGRRRRAAPPRPGGGAEPASNAGTARWHPGDGAGFAKASFAVAADPNSRCQDPWRAVAWPPMATKAQATWGGRFSAGPAALMLEFSESVFFVHRL